MEREEIDCFEGMTDCEIYGHDLVPYLGFDNVVKGDICRICSQVI